MAITIPIISEFNDKGVKGAQGALNDLRRNVANAEGSFGKMKAGFGVMSDYVKANAGTMAAVAGVAIAKFAFDAAGQFRDLAISVDKFRDASGLTLDEASRWTEVAGDIGIDAGAIETAINKMNRKVADSPKLFEDLGIEMAKHADGTYDPQGTFLNVIDALKNMKDPAEKATTATAILGKGWMELADLIERGSSNLSSSLASVSDAKLIDENEVRRAEDFRDATAQLNDKWEDFVLLIGEKAIPAITDLVLEATKLADPVITTIDYVGKGTRIVLDAINPLDSAMKGVERIADSSGSFWERAFGGVQTLTSVIPGVNVLVDGLGDSLFEAGDGSAYSADQAAKLRDAWIEGYGSMIDARRAVEEIEDRLYDVDYALAVLEGNITERETFRKLQDDIKNASDAAWTAFMEKTPEALAASESALDDARLAAGKYISKLDGIPEEMKTEIIAALDRANIQEIETILNQVTRAREVAIIARYAPAGEIGSGGRPLGEAPPAETMEDVIRRLTPPARAMGGPVTAGTSYLVGERGPEIFTPAMTGRISNGSGTVIVNVAGSVTSERDLVETIRRGLVDAQRNGANLVYVN